MRISDWSSDVCSSDLTELVPLLLQTFGKTQEPDRALVKFDGFVAGLPAGMQLLSLLYNNPNLLELMAEIMGSAPQLADRLNRNPHLLEAVLAPDFFDPIPPAERSEEHTSELQSLMRISYAVFCLKKKKK